MFFLLIAANSLYFPVDSLLGSACSLLDSGFGALGAKRSNFAVCVQQFHSGSNRHSAFGPSHSHCEAPYNSLQCGLFCHSSRRPYDFDWLRAALIHYPAPWMSSKPLSVSVELAIHLDTPKIAIRYISSKTA